MYANFRKSLILCHFLPAISLLTNETILFFAILTYFCVSLSIDSGAFIRQRKKPVLLLSQLHFCNSSTSFPPPFFCAILLPSPLLFPSFPLSRLPALFSFSKVRRASRLTASHRSSQSFSNTAENQLDFRISRIHSFLSLQFGILLILTTC